MQSVTATEAMLQAAVAARRLLDDSDDVARDEWDLGVYALAHRGEEALLAVLNLGLWTSSDFYERQAAARLVGGLVPASRGTLSKARDLLKAGQENAVEPWMAAVAADIAAHAALWEHTSPNDALHRWAVPVTDAPLYRPPADTPIR